MGISIENYRIRIGSHNKFVQAKKSMFSTERYILQPNVDPTFTVCADFNQGSASMFGSNAGRGVGPRPPQL